MQPKQRLFALVAGLVIVVAAIWYFLRRAETEEAAPPTAAAEEPPAPTAVAPPPRPAPAAPAPAPPKAEPVAEDGVPFMPAHDGELPQGYAHFHPITPKHKRIYRENGLIESLNGAMDVNDAPGLRKLLEQYRQEYPEDEWELQGGYAVIADCIDQPGEAAREAARRWIASHNGSPLKRFANRHCLESAP